MEKEPGKRRLTYSEILGAPLILHGWRPHRSRRGHKQPGHTDGRVTAGRQPPAKQAERLRDPNAASTSTSDFQAPELKESEFLVFKVLLVLPQIHPLPQSTLHPEGQPETSPPRVTVNPAPPAPSASPRGSPPRHCPSHQKTPKALSGLPTCTLTSPQKTPVFAEHKHSHAAPHAIRTAPGWLSTAFRERQSSRGLWAGHPPRPQTLPLQVSEQAGLFLATGTLHTPFLLPGLWAPFHHLDLGSSTTSLGALPDQPPSESGSHSYIIHVWRSTFLSFHSVLGVYNQMLSCEILRLRSVSPTRREALGEGAPSLVPHPISAPSTVPASY